MHFLRQLIRFGVQEALSCIFPAAIFIILAASKIIDIPFLYRHDFILIACLIVQFLMVYFKLETVDELKVISLFHLIGLVLEIFKVHMGSWAYPEYALTKIGGVPLYSGFMYASVASYVCQAWKRFDLKFVNWPENHITYSIAAAIYINFFSHHFMMDLRWIIILSLFVAFRGACVEFRVGRQRYNMPVILSFFLIGFFIWIAENISTFLGAWKYPNQDEMWHMVHIGKISSWFLLVIISIVIVVNLKHFKYKQRKKSLDYRQINIS
ncbi:Uncharacterized membrane protein YoaT, DUF817 family [Peptoclostridium litorale DSM 5388]|uniref:DUF817 domain-containing protein n=1 Tax=Peptoclostridium litorale DSM 5388 TaxID=1121324 RepID=A0A069RLK2_PEPLI|nr:DUF817 domain-containing protein [Peptoclostridium litorale]KDR95072.1 hypothetical protein CLIT_11c01010 [Peptoclostridium litorale DSM 5388]SIN75475.1 Uncharacterized membrane protein YoaT, DUF817 family [Peptoclostridium litorale DSM 5388]